VKKLTLLSLISLAALTITGCNQEKPVEPDNPDTPQSEKITDMIGREVDIIPGSYKKIVCIGAGALRLYSYVGDVNLLAGVEDIDNYTLENRPKMFDGAARPYFIANKEIFKNLPSCGVGGPQAQAAEAEKILSCDPDLVISEYEDVDKANALQEQIGVPVITMKYGSKGVFDESIKNSINLLGKVLDKNEKSNKLVSYINEQEELLSTLTKTETSDKKAYICGLGNWGTTDYLMTAQNYEPFNVANITNVVTDLVKDGIQKIEKEKFESLGPSIDVMIIDAAAIKNIKPLYKEDPSIFNSCKAWNEGEVYLEMPYNAYYTNVELALVNAWWGAKVVHSEALKDLSIEEKTKEVTEAFLGKDLTSEIFAAPTSMGGYQKIDTSTFFN